MNNKEKKTIIVLISLIVFCLVCFFYFRSQKVYRITFDCGEESKVFVVDVERGNKIEKPQDPIREGYEFVEWQLNGQTYDFDSTITRDIILIALWNQVVSSNTRIVNYDSDGGSIIDSQIVENGMLAKKPEDPIKEGYNFVEWQLDNQTYDFSTQVTSDITLVALWNEILNSKTVIFDSNGGTKVNSQIVESGRPVKNPGIPYREGYEFIEWQLNGKIYDFNAPVTSDITLIAKWNKIDNKRYIVWFDSNGGSSVSSRVVNSGSTISKPSNPTKNGYTFIEWQLNGKAYNFNTPITSNMTLIAKWNQSNSNVPIYNDGTINNSYWNIKQNNTNSQEALNTRNNINKAIEYANKNGIKNIKLVKGNYYINVNSKFSVNGKNYYLGIKMMDNVNLDLNGSTIHVISNSLNSYSIVLFDGVKNSKITNGTLIGDRDIHIYSSNSTHEHGMGVYIARNCSNVIVSNLNISSITGDGIYILNEDGSLKASKISYNKNHSINIINNNIHYFRRNGISIISGNDIYISNNNIHDCVKVDGSSGHDKSSVSPRAAIDMERNNINQMYSNIFISNNKMYDVYGKVLSIEDNVNNLYFENNEISKGIYFALDSAKAYEASNNYQNCDYSSFKVCNTLQNFINNTNSTISNNKLIASYLVTKTDENYYNSNLDNSNIYSSLQSIEDINLKISSKTLKKGLTNYKLYWKDYFDILPSDAHQKKIYWSIENESIITYGDQKNPVETPWINTINTGETYIVGKTIDGSNKTFRIKIVVTE